MENMEKFEDYLQVKDACKLLGICKTTLTMWELKNKLVPIRHPKSGWRLFKREDIFNILRGLDQGKK